ncbi:protein PFC0760c-like [Odontomachus brunneus]|uniref:protein PFC0760c-like n=1 Tax=Odontomachus brunneus TaxID=486640 RepID=UPI0013F1AD34|nr:protein PFC0760c-like [Odontomachus brunneus]
MNYYIPIQKDHAETANASASSSNPSLRSHHITRILGRRYDLTSTFYKYLEIGISVGPVSCVEIILGDNRGNHMILPHQIWKEIMHKRTDFDRLLQQAETSPFWIRDLSIKSDKIQNAKVQKLTLFGIWFEEDENDIAGIDEEEEENEDNDSDDDDDGEEENNIEIIDISDNDKEEEDKIEEEEEEDDDKTIIIDDGNNNIEIINISDNDEAQEGDIIVIN